MNNMTMEESDDQIYVEDLKYELQVIEYRRKDLVQLINCYHNQETPIKEVDDSSNNMIEEEIYDYIYFHYTENSHNKPY